MSGMTPPARFGGYCVICGEKAQPGRYPFPLALASRSADHHGLRQRRSFGRKSRSGKLGNPGCTGSKVTDYREEDLLMKKRRRTRSAMAFIKSGEGRCFRPGPTLGKSQTLDTIPI